MNVCFLTLIFGCFGSAYACPPAKRMRIASSSSDMICAPSSSSDMICAPSSPINALIAPSSPTNTPTVAPASSHDTLCNSCFSKVSDHSIKISTSSESNFQEIYRYLKLLNDNYRCYKLAENRRYEDAIEALFESDQKTLFSTIYDLKFKNNDEMQLFSNFLIEYCASIDQHCNSRGNKVMMLFTGVMTRISIEDEKTVPDAKYKCIRQLHAYYHPKYHEFVDSKLNSEKLMESLADSINRIKKNSRIAKSAESISIAYDFYDALLPKLAKLKSLTDIIVLKTLSPFIHNEKKNKFPIDVVGFQPVYAFIDYQAMNKALKPEIDQVIRAVLLNKKHLATESVYSLLRLYKIHERLPFSLLVDYTISVHGILREHRGIQNGEERRVFINLHCNLIMKALPFYFQNLLSRENLLCFERLKRGIPLLSDAMDNLRVSYIIKKYECAGSSSNLVTLLRDCWKTRDFLRIESIISKIQLANEQVLGLLKAISTQKFEVNIKVSLLCELVKYDILNAERHEYISKSLNGDTELVVIYSLALISHVCRAKKAGQEIKNGILDAYFELCASHPSIFTYSSGPHSVEYYVLHAYGILFKQKYFSNGKFKVFWRGRRIPNYPLEFFTSLWSGLSGILQALRQGAADYEELAEVKMMAFNTIKLHVLDALDAIEPDSQGNQDYGALDRPVHNLFESNLPLSDVYTHYFDSDPRYANYLIARYFFYCSEVRGKRFDPQIDNERLKQNRSAIIWFLGTQTAEEFNKAKMKSARPTLKSVIYKISGKIYSWGVVQDVEHDKELRKLAEKMASGLSDALLYNMNAEDSTTPKELQVMQALSSIFGPKK